MTPPPPPAATAAPRVGATRRLGGRPGSRIPRRVSGPVRPKSLRAAAGGLALPRPIDVHLPRPSAHAVGDALARVRGIFRGRGVIVVLAAMLLGLVFLQVSLLKLNTQITQNVERAQTLERDNAVKRTVISRLDAGRRIQDVAGQLGMVMPGAGSVCYLDAGRAGSCSGGDPAAAASAVDAVDETAPVIDATAVDPAQAQAEADTTPAATTQEPATDPTAAPVAQEPAPAAQEPAAQEPAAQEPAPVAQAPAEQTTAAGGIAAGGTP